MLNLIHAFAPVWEGCMMGHPLMLTLEKLTTQQWAVIIEAIVTQAEADPRIAHLFRSNPLLAAILADIHRQTLQHKGS